MRINFYPWNSQAGQLLPSKSLFVLPQNNFFLNENIVNFQNMAKNVFKNNRKSRNIPLSSIHNFPVKYQY